MFKIFKYFHCSILNYTKWSKLNFDLNLLLLFLILASKTIWRPKSEFCLVLKQYSHFIKDFGLDVLDERQNNFCATFYELRMWQQIRNVRFLDLPCSSNQIWQHIRRAYISKQGCDSKLQQGMHLRSLM